MKQETIKLGEEYLIGEETYSIQVSTLILVPAFIFLYLTSFSLKKGDIEGVILLFGMFITFIALWAGSFPKNKRIIITKHETRKKNRKSISRASYACKQG